jgi:predicted enzyme related to lactoylglutathione lyase
MANPFTYLELHSTDPSRARSFYVELFGWKTKDTSIPGLGTYTEIDVGEGPGAGLMAQQERGARSAWLAYVKVPKLDETVSRAQKLGATVVAPRTEIKDVGWFAVLDDSTGARFAVFEEMTRK